MRRLMAPVTIAVTFLIIVLAYFAYTKYIGPIYTNNSSQTIQVMEFKGEDITLGKLPNQSGIYGIEIEFSEFNTSNYSLIISNEEEPTHIVQIKKGASYIYKNDWYSPTCILNFRSESPSNETIKVEYRFLGLNK